MAIACLCVALLVSPPIDAQPSPPQVDTRTLPRFFTERGFSPPERFKALVVALPPRGATDAAPRVFDYNGTSDDRDDWWAASSVKLFVAIAALEQVRTLGFSPRATATFEWEDGAITREVRQIVSNALIPSDNDAYNELCDIVGFDKLNRDFFSRRNGFTATVLLRRFSNQATGEAVHGRSLRNTPAVLFREGTRERRMQKRTGRGNYPCADEGNCTTLADLAEAMRRVMLHEELPPSQRFALGEPELSLLRRALESERPRGNGLPTAIREGYGPHAVRIYHKPGYAYRWISDVMFVEDVASGRRWLIAAAAWGSRRRLDESLRHIGAFLASSAPNQNAP